MRPPDVLMKAFSQNGIVAALNGDVLEDVIATAIKDTAYAGIVVWLPALLVRKRDTVDIYALCRRAGTRDDERKLGYLMDIAGKCLATLGLSDPFEHTKNLLYRPNEPPLRWALHGSPYGNSDEYALNWNIITSLRFTDFMDQVEQTSRAA